MVQRLLQITDCHLGVKKGEKLLGLDADLSLCYVLEQLAADYPVIDALVCSGDLSNDGNSVAPYQRLSTYLPKHIKQLWLPGNHDDNLLMQQAMQPYQQYLGDYALGCWHVTLLDSSIPNDVPGAISANELQRAVDVLQKHPDKHHIIFMHHHLKPIDCAWLDTQVVKNAEQVLTTLANFPQLKMIVCGHVHQDNHQQFEHIQLYTTPSTCIQFKPHSEGFAVDGTMPGYRWFHLHDDGSYETGVQRIAQRELGIEYGSNGY